MKFLHIVFSIATADLTKIGTTFNKRGCRQFPKDQRPPWCDKNQPRGTALDDQLELLSAAGSYGCWCDLTNSLHLASNGSPVNALDEACKNLHHGYNCAAIDDPSCNGRTLDASKGEYVLPLKAVSPLVDPTVECANANPGNTCGYNTCVLEANFLRITYAPVFAGDQAWIDMWNDVSLVHSPDGGFDFEGTCNAQGNGNGNGNSNNNNNNNSNGNSGTGPTPIPGFDVKACCGPYPNRHVYFTSRAQCCNDVISPFGTC